MTIAAAALLTVGAVIFILFIRPKDLPEDAPASPVQFLEDRKARIYEGLRDLNFEFRVGKLSEEDYQKTKLGLQQDLARVLSEIDAASGPQPARPPEKKTAEEPAPAGRVCPHCGASFPQALKFCGECGKPMQGEVA